ncbi:MAG: ribonuclease HII [Bacteroidetes bacterium]|nr:MAG: ribonuclease HII [Bacteroidota bacterium]
MALAARYTDEIFEAGVDEAGRGCLAGPVVAAAVMLPPDFCPPLLNDSKKLSHKQRISLRREILQNAISWSVGMIGAFRIDRVNILNATYEAMHEAIDGLHIRPDYLIIDGNRFRPFRNIPHSCIVKGDGKYAAIAAASVLAKTYRDEIMQMLDEQFPQYRWASNKGYPTRAHKEAIRDYGLSPQHRKTFNWQLPLTLFEGY